MLLVGKLTISMAIFNSYVKLPEGICSNALVHVVAEKTPTSHLVVAKFLRPLKPSLGLSCLSMCIIFVFGLYNAEEIID